MNQRSAFVLVAVGLVLGLGARNADAGLVTWEFGGEITLVSDPDNDLGGAITVGTPFSGSFTFESTTPDSSPASVGFGLYIDAITAVSGHVGSSAFSGESGFTSQIRITDSPGGDNDGLTLVAENIFFSDLDLVFNFGLLLTEPTGLALDSDELPSLPPDLLAFPDPLVVFNFNESDAFVSGELRVLVPEPSTLAILALGAFALLHRRRFLRSLGAFGVVLILGQGVSTDVLAQQWDPDWGPVIIGGDDLDEHRATQVNHQTVLTGDAFIREGLKFLVANVKTQNTIAVCVGCQGLGLTAFEQNFDAANLVGWGRAHLNVRQDIVNFFTNDPAGTVKIQNAGLIYITSDWFQLGTNSGISELQIEVVNDHAIELKDFVKTDGGGLFTHTQFGHQTLNGYLWLETLVPEIRPAASTFGTDESNLTCEGDDVFFPGITDAQRDAMATTGGVVAWHNRFETVPGEPRLGGLSVVMTGGLPAEGSADFVILAAPIPAGFGDCNGDGIPDACDLDCNANGVDDGCDISTGVSLDCNENGVPDECEIASGISEDCNGDGVLNECEIASPTGSDCDGNGIPDTCDADTLIWSIRNERLSLEEGVPGSGANAQFGTSVAAGDNKVIVGAPYDDLCDPVDPNCNAGVAFVFSRTHNSWVTDDGRLEPAVLAAGAKLGTSVGMSTWNGTQFAVVGAPGANKAYVFYLRDDGNDNPLDGGNEDPTDDTWIELATLEGDANAAGFGKSVAIDGETIVVGAPWTMVGGNAQAGAAYVFRHNDGGTPSDLSDDTWDPEKTSGDPDGTFGTLTLSAPCDKRQLRLGRVG